MALTKKAEKTRSRLLESARRLISERGFDHVSVEDITKDSGVAKGTFYHYFECKEEVVAELSFQSIQTIIKKAIDYDGDVRERCLYYFIELYKDASWSGVRLVRQWIKETMEAETPDSRTRECLDGIRNTVMDIFVTGLGKGKGELRADAPLDMLSKLLMSHFFGVLTIWCMMNGEWDIVAEADVYARSDIDNLLGAYSEEYTIENGPCTGGNSRNRVRFRF